MSSEEQPDMDSTTRAVEEEMDARKGEIFVSVSPRVWLSLGIIAAALVVLAVVYAIR